MGAFGHCRAQRIVVEDVTVMTLDTRSSIPLVELVFRSITRTSSPPSTS
jgi:hypothetical protein